jgi:hypothetical protein
MISPRSRGRPRRSCAGRSPRSPGTGERAQLTERPAPGTHLRGGLANRREPDRRPDVGHGPRSRSDATDANRCPDLHPWGSGFLAVLDALRRAGCSPGGSASPRAALPARRPRPAAAPEFKKSSSSRVAPPTGRRSPSARRDPRPPERGAARRSCRCAPSRAVPPGLAAPGTRVPLRDSRSPIPLRRRPPGRGRRARAPRWGSSYTRCAQATTASYEISAEPAWPVPGRGPHRASLMR